MGRRSNYVLAVGMHAYRRCFGKKVVLWNLSFDLVDCAFLINVPLSNKVTMKMAMLKVV
jgi:hypothetical protein